MQDLHLNVEQETMFFENKNLIHAAIQKFINTNTQDAMMEYDDLFQIGSMGLCKAIKTYTNKKYAFSTYAMVVIRNELYNATRVKCDAVYKADNILDDENYRETIAYESTKTTNAALDNIIYEQQIAFLKERGSQYGGIAQKGIAAIIMLSQNYTYNEIAKLFEVDSKTITAWVSRARAKLKKDIANSGIF